MGRINSPIPIRGIVAGNDVYMRGFHRGNPGGLDAVDTDLAVGNIKDGETIFGKLGTYEGAAPSITQAVIANNTSTGAGWTSIGSGLVPAAASKVYVWGTCGPYVTSNPGHVRVTYNGVERVLISGQWRGAASWIGDSIGSDANVIVYTKHYSGSEIQSEGGGVYV